MAEAESGVDEAINYREVDDLSAKLGEHCPDGIDVYFDNVGGDHLEAAIRHQIFSFNYCGSDPNVPRLESNKNVTARGSGHVTTVEFFWMNL